MNLLRIAFSNIKKRKSSAITFFAITIMSALMLSIALSLLLNANSFYERKRQEYNAGDILISVPKFAFDDDMIEYIENYDGAKNYQISDSLLSEIKYYSVPSQKNRKQFSVSESSAIGSLKINTVSIIDELKDKPSSYIYLPLGFKYSGFESGDRFFFETTIETYEFIIAGFFEDVQLGASTMGIKNVFVDSASYNRISMDSSFLPIRYFAIQFDKISTSYLFATDFSERFDLINQDGYVFDYETAVMAHTMFALIMAFMLIIVAVIVLIVALIIVKFSINNNISEDMRSLGALKSIGFTSKQIILSILFQFLLLALFGCMVGVLLGGLSASQVGNIVTATSGLFWSSASFLIPALISAIVICTVTALITFFTARKSKAITPIVALRGGIETHSFKRNYAPLEKTKLPLDFALAIKTFFIGLKSNITAFVVVTMFAFMTVLGFTLYNNFVTDTSAFIQMIGMEPAQIQVGVYDEADISILDEAAKLDGVVNLAKFNNYSTIVDGNTVRIAVWEDITEKMRNSLVKGRYPIHENEIALTSTTQKVLHRNIGDMISIEFNGTSASYLVVGITQGVSSDVNSDMTLDGFNRLKNDAALKWGYLYLDTTDGEKIDDFIGALKRQYGSKISTYNMQELIDGTLIGIKEPVAIATYLVLFINLATAIFVFFLLVNTIIRRKNKDLGIMKALGFTSRQLVMQILLSFLPSIILGLVLGSVFGVLLTNSILGLMFAGIGIAKAIFAIPIAITIIVQFVLLFVCLLTILLVALKIKRIAPQKLITEQ